MANYFVNLPAPQVPRNALMDFAPINNALDGIQHQNNVNRSRGDMLEQRDYQRGREAKVEARTQESHDSDMRTQRVRKMVGLAQMIDAEPDKAKAGAMWSSMMQADPKLSSLLPEHARDHMTGPKFLIAESRGYVDPVESEIKKQTLSNSRLSAQATSLDIEAKRRDLNSPKGVLTELDQNKTLMYTDPRTGSSRVLREPSSGANGPYKDPKQRADVEEGLRKEVTAAAKNFNVISEAKTSLEAISKAPNAATDMAMVFSFMKILDPDSVVRETEYAAAARAAGIPDRIAGVIERIQSGQFLTPQQRSEFLGVAKTLAAARGESHAKVLDRYKGISERLQVDPRNVIPEGVPQQSAQPNNRQAPYRAQNGAGQVIESDDGVNWRPAR